MASSSTHYLKSTDRNDFSHVRIHDRQGGGTGCAVRRSGWKVRRKEAVFRLGEPKSPTKNNKIPLVLWSASWELNGSGAIIGANDGLRRKKNGDEKTLCNIEADLPRYLPIKPDRGKPYRLSHLPFLLPQLRWCLWGLRSKLELYLFCWRLCECSVYKTIIGKSGIVMEGSGKWEERGEWGQLNKPASIEKVSKRQHKLTHTRARAQRAMDVQSVLIMLDL